MSCDCQCTCGGSKNNCGGGAGCACQCGDGCGCCFFIPTNRPDVCAGTELAPSEHQVDCCPSESVGGCVPVHPDPLGYLSGDCCRPAGGDMTILAPLYALTVANASDTVLRDSEGRPVLVDGKVQSTQVQTGVAGICAV